MNWAPILVMTAYAIGLVVSYRAWRKQVDRICDIMARIRKDLIDADWLLECKIRDLDKMLTTLRKEHEDFVQFVQEKL